MAFSLTPDVNVVRDQAGRIRQLSHLQQPYVAAEALVVSPRTLVASYLDDVADLYQVPAGALATLHEPLDHQLRPDEDNRLRLLKERSAGRARVVSSARR